ncbi:MAG: radical SAM protein [Clostridia bacterium]|nr:radical SAM protein [Clostridia bacterium]
MSIEEFKKIDDIIEYAKNFNYDSPKFWPGSEDRCKVCTFTKDRISQIGVGLSYACNLKCHNCFYDGHHKDIPELKELYFSILEKIKGNNLSSIQLTDVGEPFFYFYKTLDYLKSLKYGVDTKSVNFLTNGTLLSKDRIDELVKVSKETNIIYNFIVSVDGITKKTYENTRIGGNFEKTIENITYLHKFFNVGINYTIRKPNMSDTLNIKNFFKELGFTQIDIYYDIYDEDCKKLYYKNENLLKYKIV